MTTTALSLTTGAYTLSLATSEADVIAAQRLRYAVFNRELGEGLAASETLERDVDEFDPICAHLLVRANATGEIIGTYRMQSGAMALASGLGYYSAREFDFAPFEPMRAEILELGRACVTREHRNQTVITLLWRGIARHAQANGVRYLVGCSSLTSRNEADGLAAWRELAPHCLAPVAWRTHPMVGWACRATGADAPAGGAKIPRLMTAYLALGARLCGEPAIDREFGTIDFLTWVDLQELAPRVARKFLG